MNIKSVILPAFLISTSFIVPQGSCDSSRETPVVKVVRENAEAVVNISTEHIVLLRENPVWGSYGSEFDYWFDQFFGVRQRTQALKLKSVGSGVIVDKEGVIVTNAHVVHMASNVFVILSDGTSVKGKVVYEDPGSDLAIVRVKPPRPLKEARLGASQDVMIGETVVAIGNPLGFENSVTVGVVSGIGREIYASRGEKVFDELIQTDAPINPGNSGGGLLNLDGELIGINVAVVQNSQSIGFAIPVKKIKEALEAHTRNQGFSLRRGKGGVPAPSAPAEPVPDRFASPPRQERWDPSSEMERIRQEMDEMFRGVFGRGAQGGGPGMFNTDIFYDAYLDLNETPDGYEIKLDIAGLDKDKIDIEINDQAITISGQGSGREEETGPQSAYRAERYHSFLKTIPLPEDADGGTVTTNVEGDFLVIRMKKKSF